ncbi:hypothetical protein QI270_11110 [Staphylococcus saprophyticus]|nr:hypothetical protein [Staphylococcus saprophyticus]
MAYEYEIKIPMWLEDGRWLNMNVDDEVLDELEEVYRKAKTMDEILNIDLAQHDEEYADNVMKVVNKYTEDK